MEKEGLPKQGTEALGQKVTNLLRRVGTRLSRPDKKLSPDEELGQFVQSMGLPEDAKYDIMEALLDSVTPEEATKLLTPPAK